MNANIVIARKYEPLVDLKTNSLQLLRIVWMI